MRLPRLYPIADRETLDARGIRLSCFAGEMARAGIEILQYRDKLGAAQEVLRGAAVISELFAGSECMLILNDRPDLAVLAGWSGVHVGHRDMTPCAARKLMGGPVAHGTAERTRGTAESEFCWVGISTHTEEQVAAADSGCADYIAVGPIFATASKADAEPPIGLEGLRRARALTKKPIVAIGGITRENSRAVVDAGADSVAVIGEMFARGERPGRVAGDFLELLR